MADRRSLMEGLKPADPKVEEDFVYGNKKARQQSVETVTTAGTNMTGRVPLTTRVRTDLAMNLKRASLERQLAGHPLHTLQDIMEAALTAWLATEGEGR